MRTPRISWPLALVLVVAITAIAVYAIVDQLVGLPGRSLSALMRESTNNAKQVQAAFADLFQIRPRITVQEHLVFEETKPVLELIVLSRQTQITHETDQTWLGSTKHLRMSGLYLVKAGYDLNEQLQVDVHGRTITIQTPPAKIISVEQKKISVEELRDGLWNKILPQDVEGELTKLPQLAEQKDQDLPRQAEEEFQKRLQQRLPNLEVQVQVKTAVSPTK
jgi:Protein of unknown function (DUF4230)